MLFKFPSVLNYSYDKVPIKRYAVPFPVSWICNKHTATLKLSAVSSFFRQYLIMYACALKIKLMNLNKTRNLYQAN